jgi:hypothetical protein
MRTVISYGCTLLALLGFGFALVSSAPGLLSDCSSRVTGPWLAVFIGLLVYAGLGFVAIRKNPRTAYVLLIGTTLLIIASDWYMQQALRSLLAMDCTVWTFR